MKSTTALPESILSQLQTAMVINGEFRMPPAEARSPCMIRRRARRLRTCRKRRAADVDAVQAAKTALHHASWRDILPAARSGFCRN